MVVLAVAICNNKSKPLLVRGYMSATRAHLEGLIGDFRKGRSEDETQHTYVENDAVRYVFQPLDDLCLIIITSKISNIIEDLETLHLLANLVTKICSGLKEPDIIENTWVIINSFDEVISYKGQREKVNLEQIKCFCEMESHEERMYELELAEKQKKVKELRKLKERELTGAAKRGLGSQNSGAYSGGSNAPSTSPTAALAKPNPQPSQAAPKRKGLVLGEKSDSSNKFMNQLASEDTNLIEKPKEQPKPKREEVAQEHKALSARESDIFSPPIPSRPKVAEKAVHVNIVEHLNAIFTNDGTAKAFEVTGEVVLTFANADVANATLALTKGRKNDYILKMHPKVDKTKLSQNNIISSTTGSFPPNSNLTILRWRADMKSEKELPISVSCWPSPNSDGLSLSIVCEPTDDYSQLYDIGIAIPTDSEPTSMTASVGEAEYDESGGVIWVIPRFEDNSSATLEINIRGEQTTSCFPISVNFGSRRSLAQIGIEKVVDKNGKAMDFSVETNVIVEQFLIDEN